MTSPLRKLRDGSKDLGEGGGNIGEAKKTKVSQEEGSFVNEPQGKIVTGFNQFYKNGDGEVRFVYGSVRGIDGHRFDKEVNFSMVKGGKVKIKNFEVVTQSRNITSEGRC